MNKERFVIEQSDRALNPQPEAALHDRATPGSWQIFAETYRNRLVYVVMRTNGRKVEYVRSERTERKQRYFLASIAQRHADELNAKTQGEST